MEIARRAFLFALGVFLLVYSLTVHPVQIALVIAALLLMGVVTWEQIATIWRRNGETHDQRSP